MELAWGVIKIRVLLPRAPLSSAGERGGGQSLCAASTAFVWIWLGSGNAVLLKTIEWSRFIAVDLAGR